MEIHNLVAMKSAFYRVSLTVVLALSSGCFQGWKDSRTNPVITAENVKIETIAEFPNSTFLENLTVTTDNDVVFTNYFDKQIMRLSDDGNVEIFAELPDHPVAILELDDGFVVTAQGTSYLKFPAVTETNSILLLDTTGSIVAHTAAPQAKFLNGLHRLPSGELLVADSIGATLWLVNPETGELSPWLNHSLLAPDPDVETFAPGANGIKSHEGVLYVSNSSRGAIYRRDPALSGELEQFVQATAIDDFAIDDEGTIFAATHNNKLLKISPDGEVSELISNGCKSCTSVAFWPDGQSLIAINDNGFSKDRKTPTRILNITGF